VKEQPSASPQSRPPTPHPQLRDGVDGPEWHFAPRGDGTLPQLALKSRSQLSHAGRRQVGKNEGNRGPRIGTRPMQAGVYGALALDATIRAAAKFQPQRRLQIVQRERGKKPDAGRMVIRRQDLMVKVRRTPAQHLYILVVDSSGSMAAYQRMAQVKGV